MSKNQIFGPQNGPAPDFLRNTYDKSFQNLITTDYGELRPCFCKEVIPGDSIRIDPAVAVRSHPIVFPINTRIKFYCYFFYGRNRIFYQQFEDFIWGTKDGLVPPLLRLSKERAKKMISTGSLGDNLGVPSTISSGSVSVTPSLSPAHFCIPTTPDEFNSSRANILQSRVAKMINDGSSFHISHPNVFASRDLLLGLVSSPISSPLISNTFSSSPFLANPQHFGEISDCSVIPCVLRDGSYYPTALPFPLTVNARRLDDGRYVVDYTINADLGYFNLSIQDALDEYGSFCLYFGSFKDELSSGLYNLVEQSPYFVFSPTSESLVPSSLNFTIYSEGVFDATSPEFIDSNKFVGDSPIIPLSALPFRMYEFCCNYFFRNDQNNPYVLNGEPQYNQFIPSTDGGWDTNEYLIHHRNWEMDAYTSAVPSPQYGTAPLVGLTYTGGDTATVQVDVTDSDGQSRQLGIQVGVDADGTINSILHADDGVPSGSLRRLMDGTDGIQLGMSINDFRNVNAFQRFKENVLRRGLRYRNQLLSHMGVSVDYPDIDIPQFIGGFSGDLTVREVTNMAESADVALGDVAGKIDAVLTSNHTISCYCPEHGFIMGIFSIVPVPTYSQLLPRMFTRYNYLDYFQQEFAKIGYVPITHREFLPLQSNDPDTVLGYQRAFYEYMFSTDEVHGDFRTTLADFVLYRQFKEVPTLNEDFVTVKADSLNNIFAVDKVQEKYKNSAKFMCSFFFDVSHKMQIPKFGTPSLE